jgi:hypothetical protein
MVPQTSRICDFRVPIFEFFPLRKGGSSLEEAEGGCPSHECWVLFDSHFDKGELSKPRVAPKLRRNPGLMSSSPSGKKRTMSLLTFFLSCIRWRQCPA